MSPAEAAFRVAIAVAPNGGRRTKADHPDIPLTSGELARTAARCTEAGAAMIHVHVRDRDGRHLLDADAYRDAIGAIRASVGEKMIVQITSEALDLYSPAQQIDVVRQTRPEAVSLALRELVRSTDDETPFADFLAWLKRERILPQIILYEPAEAVRLAGLMQRGLVPWNDIPVLFVLGRYTPGQRSTPRDLLPFLQPGVPDFAHWSACAFGRNEAACVTAAALLGGHVRVGFENNLARPDGSAVKSNAESVSLVAGQLRGLGLALSDAADLRTALGDILT